MMKLTLVVLLREFHSKRVKGCRGIVFTHGVWMGGRVSERATENSLSGLYFRNRKVEEVDTW